MMIDGSLILGSDPLTTAKEFRSCGITLAIVAQETPCFAIWDYYHKLAENTGISYIYISY